jgi:ubiquinone/menaquinone biosynthesis C-methylase UbiE
LKDLQSVMEALLGTNVIPVIPSDARILDVGAGYGEWCVRVAKQFPRTSILGLDMVPIERPDTPENCRWICADLNEGLKFEDGSFDLVASRLVSRRLITHRANDLVGSSWGVLPVVSGPSI